MHVSMTQYNDAMLWPGHYLKRRLFVAGIYQFKTISWPGVYSKMRLFERGVYLKKYRIYVTHWYVYVEILVGVK